MRFNATPLHETALTQIYILAKVGDARTNFRIMVPLGTVLDDQIDIYKISEIDDSGNFTIFYEPDISTRVCIVIIPDDKDRPPSMNDLKVEISRVREILNSP